MQPRIIRASTDVSSKRLFVFFSSIPYFVVFGRTGGRKRRGGGKNHAVAEERVLGIGGICENEWSGF